jgi:hypothetical protein
MDSSSVDFAVVSRPVKGQTPFYKGVWGVEVSTDVMRQRFTAVFVADTEWDKCRASVMFEAGGDWRCGSSSGARALRLLRVSRASSIWYWAGLTTSTLTSVLTSSARTPSPSAATACSIPSPSARMRASSSP